MPCWRISFMWSISIAYISIGHIDVPDADICNANWSYEDDDKFDADGFDTYGIDADGFANNEINGLMLMDSMLMDHMKMTMNSILMESCWWIQCWWIWHAWIQCWWRFNAVSVTATYAARLIQGALWSSDWSCVLREVAASRHRAVYRAKDHRCKTLSTIANLHHPTMPCMYITRNEGKRKHPYKLCLSLCDLCWPAFNDKQCPIYFGLTIQLQCCLSFAFIPIW